MLFLDFLLLFMTTICVIYCWILNNRIKNLQNSRVEFARMIKELNVSISKAEANIKEMAQLSKITSAEIKSTVEEAKSANIELTDLNNQAKQNLKDLDEQIKNFNEKFGMDENSYSNTFSAKSGEKFSEDDLADVQQNNKKKSYTNHLKNFIQNIVTKDSENSQNLNQLDYYNTLRKINFKK